MRYSRVLVTGVALSVLALVPGQATANHISCGQTVSGPNVVLDSPLNCTGFGLIVAGRNTNLSLSNNAITGDGGDTGIIVTGNGATVSGGGPVQGFGSGIVVNGVRGGSITSINVNSNGTGITLVDTNAFLVSTNALAGNTSTAIALQSDSNRNELFQNTISNTAGGAFNPFGIRIIDGSDATRVIQNSVSGTGTGFGFGDGIFVGLGAKRALLDSNLSHSNTSDGINVEEPATTVTGNSANNNGHWGILAPGARDGGGNTATGNGSGNCSGVSCP